MLGFRRKRTNLHEKYDYPVKGSRSSRLACSLREDASANELAHRLDAHRHLGGDASLRDPLLVQGHYLLVLRQADRTAIVAELLPPRQSRPSAFGSAAGSGDTTLATEGRISDGDGCRGAAHLWPRALQHPLDVVSEVAQQVPAIGYLYGAR